MSGLGAGEAVGAVRACCEDLRVGAAVTAGAKAGGWDGVGVDLSTDLEWEGEEVEGGRG